MRTTLGILLIFIVACASKKEVVRIEPVTTDTTATDSVKYELIVFDAGFETWYLTNSHPSWYHSQEYYEMWNQRFVNAWNYEYNSSRYHNLLDAPINYDSNIDYGLEVNHKLFYYFQYVQHVLKIPLLSDAPHLSNY
ncbi:MAG: hypothetical protein GXO81_02340 [Chlorobi bacterium]|nr:hypothetical protein [Chlorobiota bacterium]